MDILKVLAVAVFDKPQSLPAVNADQVTIGSVLHLVLAVAGAVSLLIITLAGLQYILSQGDPQKTAKAKDTILYAIIGLVVTMISYSIVSFVVRSVG